MMNDCRLEHRPKQFTLSVRFRSPVARLREEFGKAYAAVGGCLTSSGARVAGPPFAVFHDLELANLEVEAGIPVDRAVPGRDSVRAGVIPEADVATTTHVGPYETMGPSYEKLNSWVHGQGMKAAGPACEVYLSDPAVNAASELQTKLVLPVEAA